MILVTFAVPFESAKFRETLTKTSSSTKVECLHTGVGADSAERAIRGAFAKKRYSHVVIAGFAGALSPQLAVGDLITCKSSSSATLPLDLSVQNVRFAQSDQVLVTAREKEEFRRLTGGDVVDMETETLISECRAANVPHRILRVISDVADVDLAAPPEILTAAAQKPIRGTVGLLAFLGLRPRRWIPFATMVHDCKEAQKRLSSGLEGLLLNHGRR